MRAIFHPEADDDFIRGLQHHAGKQPELGQGNPDLAPLGLVNGFADAMSLINAGSRK